MERDFKIVSYDDFARRWYQEHPDDEYLPPLIGGPMDEMFLRNGRQSEIFFQNRFFHNRSNSLAPQPIQDSLTDPPSSDDLSLASSTSFRW